LNPSVFFNRLLADRLQIRACRNDAATHKMAEYAAAKTWTELPHFNDSMKYSLRSLMIVVTLIAIVIGGRVEYLRRWAEFHEHESLRFQNAAHGTARSAVEARELYMNAATQHGILGRRCREAVHRPWIMVEVEVDDSRITDL
jgi:hypothetical protein